MAAPAQAQYSVSPVIFPIEAAPEDRDFTALVRNEGDRPLQLRVFAEDYDQSTDGDYSHAAFGEHPSTCEGRLEVMPVALTVPPGASRPITIRMRGEASPRPCWSLVYVENPAPDSGTLRVTARIGLKVYGLSAGGTYEAAITAAGVSAVDGHRALHLTVSNPSDWPIIARGTVEIRDLRGESHGRIPLRVFSVLPRHDRELVVPIDLDLPHGRYLAIPVFEYADEGFVGAQVSFRVEG